MVGLVLISPTILRHSQGFVRNPEGTVAMFRNRTVVRNTLSFYRSSFYPRLEKYKVRARGLLLRLDQQRRPYSYKANPGSSRNGGHSQRPPLHST